MQSLLLIESGRLIERLNEDTRKAQNDARVDLLTGLANRRGAKDYFKSLSKKNYQGPITIFQMDLDKFKPINDTYGHDIGDSVLKIVGARLRGLVRKTDLVSRWGGDEFLIALPRHMSDAARERIAQRIIQTVSQDMTTHGYHVSVSASIGGDESLFILDKIEAAFQRADRALYDVKLKERGQFSMYSANS